MPQALRYVLTHFNMHHWGYSQTEPHDMLTMEKSSRVDHFVVNDHKIKLVLRMLSSYTSYPTLPPYA